MLGESHELAEDFPEYQQRIEQLRASDPEFSRLFDAYNQVNTEVVRTEQGYENHADDYLEGLKMKRIELKDQIYSILHS